MPFDGKGFSNDPVVKTLFKAADLIRQHGLAKGVQRDGEGRFCLHGALSAAAFRTYNGSNDDIFNLEWGVYDRACWAVAGTLRELGVDSKLIRYNGCALWNNEPSRTKEEVIEVLETAAHKEMVDAV